ncbi:MAG TPA: SulP family inorganic anion transporter [Saprospiraceae bacterium]|nr:SulP family inorganic anion transporter [Saprospiraceae bacterium]HNT22400.1 SulP family inorganic anion transporter [Saprospiraceae bacterium]
MIDPKRPFRLTKKTRFYLHSLVRHDLKASITVFFVALPLCLGISLASNAPVYSGLIAGVIGGMVVTLISKSELSVSGPAAGLAALCAVAITDMGNIQYFFISVLLAGFFQFALGLLKLGGFTHFIPSAVIKGMLVAIGILLISKQVPLIIGYDKPDFWRGELFNIITFNHGFSHIENLYKTSSAGVVLLALLALVCLILWKKYASKKFEVLPTSFVTVLFGVIISLLFAYWFPALALEPSHFVRVPQDIFSEVGWPDFSILFKSGEISSLIWKNALIFCFIASLETLLSVAAIDKLDPFNRITPPNRELMAQGTGNFLSGLLGGLPITAVIVRSSANAEAGARSKASSFLHGFWILLAILLAIPLLNRIPYAVLAIILIRTGYNLAKPKMIREVYHQGREQFLPFIFTIVAILFTDLLIGVVIGITYAIYFLFKHTYHAGFQVKQSKEGHSPKFTIELDQHVSFLNKRRLTETLDKIPEYAIVEINGTDSAYIDRDILEIVQDFRSKAHRKHISLSTVQVPEVRTIELH